MFGYIGQAIQQLDEPTARQQHDNNTPWHDNIHPLGVDPESLSPKTHCFCSNTLQVGIPITSALAVENTDGSARIQKIQAFHQEHCP
jgi:hypothetical protein